MRMRRIGLVTALLLVLPLLWAGPSAQAYSRPDAKNDWAKVNAASKKAKNVLRNDDISRKWRAKVRVVDTDRGVRAWVNKKRRIVVKPWLRIKPGTVLRVKYKVVDFRGNKDRAVLRVKVAKPRLRKLVRRLPVRDEVHRGYDRDRFNHWIDADRDCFDTRAEVLLKETRSRARWNSYCTVKTGKWYSYYDGRTWTRASDVDVDHLVPLAEAWDSGARNWGSWKRKKFANDLREPRALVAVTDNVNQSKSDRDPAEWMPSRAKCRYIRQWVAVKHRWRLNVDRTEKRALKNRASNCRNRGVLVRWR